MIILFVFHFYAVLIFQNFTPKLMRWMKYDSKDFCCQHLMMKYCSKLVKPIKYNAAVAIDEPPQVGSGVH